MLRHLCGRSFATLRIHNLDKVKLLHRLWENQTPALFYARNKLEPPIWDEKEAKKSVCGYVGYFLGRSIKMDFTGDTIESDEYDTSSKRPAHDIVKALRGDHTPSTLFLPLSRGN
jgi:hypothetical protein